MVKKGVKGAILTAVLIILAVAGALYFKFYPTSGFSVSPDYPIKMDMVPGAEAKTSIKITNNEKETKDFQIKLNGLSEIASLSESEFSLGPRESKDIEIFFNDTQNVSHVYFANLIVSSDGFEEKEPVLLTFEESEHLFVIIQKPIPKYFDVYPGGKLGVEISVFNLGTGNYPKELKANYEIFSPERKIFSYSESLVINNELSFSKVFDINSDVEYGDYVFVSSMEYNGITSISSYLFKVEPKPKVFSFERINTLILIFLIFVILIMVLFVYFIKSRDDLLLQLRKQQSRELAKNIELIAAIQKKAPETKKEKFEKIKEEVVKKIKQKHERQIKELVKLKKRKVKENSIQNQLKKWKEQGYKFPNIKKEIPAKSVSSQIAEWKKQGYRFQY